MTDQEVREMSKKMYDTLCEIRKEKSELTFRTRTKNDMRKKKGYVFQGNSNYIAIPFYSGGSINRTGCILYVVKIDMQYIEIVCDKSKLDDVDIIKKIIGKIKIECKIDFKEYDTKYTIKYIYVFNKNDYIGNLKVFVNNIIPIIDVIVNDVNSSSNIKKISSYDFESKYLIPYFADYNKSIVSECIKLLEENKNLVLTGTPGVGKTYLANEIAKKLLDNTDNIDERIIRVQFHPSYDYTDFIEGLRPVKSIDSSYTKIDFIREDGQLKRISKKAIQSSTVAQIDNFNESLERFIDDIQNNSDSKFKVKSKKGNEWEFELSSFGNGFVTTSNSTSKIYINFEQLYNVYRGFKGVPLGGNDSYRRLILDRLKKDYQLKDYKKGTEAKGENIKYVLIIDEINRGDISKIFGEAFTLIEKDKRNSKFKVQTQYQNLVPSSDEFADGFYLPSNLYIIGTMNDIDRSVESFDFAMRRRFSWVNIEPSDTQEEMWKGKSWADKASNRLENLNTVIRELDVLGEEYVIGPSYFLNLKGETEKDFKSLWENHICPLLREYLRGRDNKIELLNEMEKAYNNELDEEEIEEFENE